MRSSGEALRAQQFEVGDLIGDAERADTVQIKLVAVSPTIVAEVTALGDFYSARRLTGEHGHSKGFVLGETLVFRFNGQDWIIDRPLGRPWHILGITRQGKKFFEHYR